MAKDKVDAKLKITLIKSVIGRKKLHKEIAAQLGLNKPHQSTIHNNIPSVLGMVNKIKYLLEVEEVKL